MQNIAQFLTALSLSNLKAVVTCFSCETKENNDKESELDGSAGSYVILSPCSPYDNISDSESLKQDTER